MSFNSDEAENIMSAPEYTDDDAIDRSWGVRAAVQQFEPLKDLPWDSAQRDPIIDRRAESIVRLAAKLTAYIATGER